MKVTLSKIPHPVIYFLITFLIIFLFIYFVPILSYQTKTLPDGTIMKMHRLNKQISVKPLGSNLYYIADPSGSISYRNCETNEEISYVPSNFNDNLYKTCLSVFKDY